MHVGDMKVNHLLWEQFDYIFNVGGYKQILTSWYVRIASEVSDYHFLPWMEGSCGHVNICNIIFNSFDPHFSVDFRFN